MPRKIKTSYKLPRRTDQHVSNPRTSIKQRKAANQAESHSDEPLKEQKVDTLFLSHWAAERNGQIPEEMLKHLLSKELASNDYYKNSLQGTQLSKYSNEVEDETDDSEDDDGKTERDPYRLWVRSAQRSPDSPPQFINWLELHSEAAHEHARAEELVPFQQNSVQRAEAITMMQNATLNNFEKISQPITLGSTLSMASHMSKVENRQLDSIELLIMCIRNFWFDNLEVKIGSTYMHVDRYLFSYYVKSLRDYANHHLELPSNKVSMSMLAMFYNWMLNDEMEMPVEKAFVLIYNTAKYLDVRTLLEQYWHTFSSSKDLGLWEAGAFSAYLSAKHEKCGDLMSIFLSRVRKCFLPLIASDDYLGLDANEVTFLLKLDTLNVNCEDEIFFSAVRWLEHDWENREQHVPQIMSSVRFRMVSPWLQRSICFTPETDLIRKLSSNHIVQAMLWHACLYGEAIVAYEDCPESTNDPIVRKFRAMKDVNRYWVYCSKIPHHHAIQCPIFHRLTYASFKQMLKCLQVHGNEYTDLLEFVPYKYSNSHKCCEKFGSRTYDEVFGINFETPIYRFNIDLDNRMDC